MKSARKMMALFLAIVLAFALAAPAMASYSAGSGIGGGPATPTPAPAPRPTLPPPTDKDIEIMFHGGDDTQGELNVAATLLDAQGKYHVTIDKKIPVPAEVIPGTITADQYYTHIGWVLENDYRLGNFDNLVNMTTYIPNDKDTFYAIYQDTWTPFKDMKQDRSDWFYKYVRDLSIQGVINGYPGNVFKPLGYVTWGEALKLIMLATGYDVQAKTGEHWASGYLTKALADGLVSEEQNIDLAESITRLEYAQVAAKAMKLPESTITSPFADTSDKEVVALFEAGIVEGNFNAAGDRQFHPRDLIVRSELSAVIWRINQFYKNK